MTTQEQYEKLAQLCYLVRLGQIRDRLQRAIDPTDAEKVCRTWASVAGDLADEIESDLERRSGM